MTYIFESGLAHHIEGLIQQKRADGYAYNSEEKLLKRFDTFCVQNYPELTTVTYEMAAKWSEARPGEGDAYHNRCMSMVKVLSEYILSLGQEAYIPNFFCKAYRPVLYIESNAVSLIEEERPFQPPLLAHSRHEKTLLSSVWSGMRGQGQNLYVPGVIFGKNLPCKPRWKG